MLLLLFVCLFNLAKISDADTQPSVSFACYLRPFYVSNELMSCVSFWSISGSDNVQQVVLCSYNMSMKLLCVIVDAHVNDLPPFGWQ